MTDTTRDLIIRRLRLPEEKTEAYGCYNSKGFAITSAASAYGLGYNTANAFLASDPGLPPSIRVTTGALEVKLDSLGATWFLPVGEKDVQQFLAGYMGRKSKNR
jgi:hypothetical protein